MNLRTLSIAKNSLKSILASNFYLKTGIDFTFPSQIYAQVNEKCNSHCVMCDVWRTNDIELPSETWIKAIKKIKNYIGNFKICFSGGEVFLKKDIYNIFEFCHTNNILFGITTNGILFNDSDIEHFLSLNPYNINISLDSLNQHTYEYIRGVDALNIVKNNISNIIKYKKKYSNKVKVTLKTVVNNRNINEIDKIAQYAHEMDIDGITFDIIKKRRNYFEDQVVDEFEEIYNVNKVDLMKSAGKLIAMKNIGFKILNSQKDMIQWVNHDTLPMSTICDVPLKNFYIFSSGNMKFCDFSDVTIGNIKDDNFDTLWNSKSTHDIKKNHVNCKKPCAYCMKRELKDYIGVFKSFIK